MASLISQTYRNVMEPLVAREAAKQIQQLPTTVKSQLHVDDVIAYALNVLPSLYATTEAGWQWQQSRAQQEFGSQITAAVRQGMMVVHQAPDRSPDRLCVDDSGLFDAQQALSEVASFLGYPKLTWPKLLPAIQHAIARRSHSSLRRV